MNTSVGDCIEELVTPLVGDLCYLNESNAIEHWTEYLNNTSDISILGMYQFACIPGTTLFAVSVENRNFSQTCNSTHFPVSLQSHPLPCPCNNSYPIRMPPDEHCPDILSHYIPTEECSASGQVPVFTQRYLIPILSLIAITTTIQALTMTTNMDIQQISLLFENCMPSIAYHRGYCATVQLM